MNELFPIIRRKRRPLSLVEGAPPVAVGNVEPPKLSAQGEDGGLKREDGVTPLPPTKPTDANGSITRKSR
jgi:hypothetical protein